jgi:NAD(P)-dependent dehydrogenase (short-subunit alcohol dehydrogenase family)
VGLRPVGDVAREGGLDLLVSNAGIEHFGALGTITQADFDLLFQTNVGRTTVRHPGGWGSAGQPATSASNQMAMDIFVSVTQVLRLLGSPGQRIARLTGKEIVEKRRGRGLWFVVGQPRSLVGFDEGVFSAGDVRND